MGCFVAFPQCKLYSLNCCVCLNTGFIVIFHWVYLIRKTAKQRNIKGLITVWHTSPHKLAFMQSTNTIVPLTADVCWGWLHHLTAPQLKCWKILQIVTFTPQLIDTNCLFSLSVCLRKGYEAASKDFEPHDLNVSVVGRSFMITGDKQWNWQGNSNGYSQER